MNISELWAEIESEQTWRMDEIRFFQNQLINIDSEKREQYRRSLVLILYAPFEGFCKFAFAHYMKAINTFKMKCNEANYAIAASALSEVFMTLRNSEKKSDIFRRSLPDDSQLHRFARDREFLERISEIDHLVVLLDDKIIDTESNLKPVVLQKILYRLGLPYDKFDNLRGQINKLLNYRNKIAHGEMKDGIPEKEYISLRDDVFFIMDEVKREIMNALENRKYLRLP
jgi:hypothetical protein